MLDARLGDTAPGFLFDVVDVEAVVAAVVQSTGAGDRLLFAGLRGGDLVVARFTLDGALDPDFGMGGIEVTDFGAAFSASAMAIRTIAGEARIVVAGSQAGDLLVARFKEDGGLDPTFNSDGIAITDLGANQSAAAVAATTTAEMIIAGTLGSDLVLVRYDTAGVPDPTFDGDGIAILDSGGIDRAAAVAVVPGDAVVLLGTSDQNFVVARFSNTGMLDPAFGVGGLMFVDFGGDDQASAMLVDAAPDVFVAGTSDGDFALAKLSAAGLFDLSFGVGGRVRVDLGSPAELTGLAFNSGGIVALGDGVEAALMRFAPSGAVDAAFGMGGLAIFSAAGTEFHPATAIGLGDQVVFTSSTRPSAADAEQHGGPATATASSTPTNTRTTRTRTATNTATPSATRTSTPTTTPAPNGAGCDDPIDCMSGNSVDDTCCLVPACDPGQSLRRARQRRRVRGHRGTRPDIVAWRTAARACQPPERRRRGGPATAAPGVTRIGFARSRSQERSSRRLAVRPSRGSAERTHRPPDRQPPDPQQPLRGGSSGRVSTGRYGQRHL